MPISCFFVTDAFHEVPFMNTSEATTKKKGRVTEQRTANVQVSRPVEVVQARQPQEFGSWKVEWFPFSPMNDSLDPF